MTETKFRRYGNLNSRSQMRHRSQKNCRFDFVLYPIELLQEKNFVTIAGEYFNPYKRNGRSHCYHLDGSTFK